MPYEILFSLLDEIQKNIIKMNTREWKERKFERKEKLGEVF